MKRSKKYSSSSDDSSSSSDDEKHQKRNKNQKRDDQKYNEKDAYGSFLNTDVQQVPLEASFVFNNTGQVLNLDHKTGSSDIKIKIDGLYYLNAVIQTDQPCQVAYFINNIVNTETITSSNTAPGFVKLQALLPLKCGNIISIKNHSSLLNLTTSQSSSGTAVPNINLNFVIFKMGRYPECN